MATNERQDDPTAHRAAEWKVRVGDIDLRHQTAQLSQQAQSDVLAAAAKGLGIDAGAVTKAHAQAYDQIEQLARARFESGNDGQSS
jgi:hypothetical protein